MLFMGGMLDKAQCKIMRRVLRAQKWGEEIGDISTLENH